MKSLKVVMPLEKEPKEHERFGYDEPDYKETIANLKRYILDNWRDNQIYL